MEQMAALGGMILVVFAVVFAVVTTAVTNVVTNAAAAAIVEILNGRAPVPPMMPDTWVP